MSLLLKYYFITRTVVNRQLFITRFCQGSQFYLYPNNME
jgi:hypothetical protein